MSKKKLPYYPQDYSYNINVERKIGHDGTFWVSYGIKTKEGKNVAFFYAWESATDGISKAVIDKYPNFFVLENNSDLWIKPEAEGVITIDELKNVIEMDTTDCMVLIDLDTKDVITGVEDWVDLDDLQNL